MVLNGLGFMNQHLSPGPHFFQKKPTSQLIAPALKAGPLHEGALGRALDTLYDHEVTALYIDSEKSGPPCGMLVPGRPRW
jgi:hypothetical protein